MRSNTVIHSKSTNALPNLINFVLIQYLNLQYNTGLQSKRYNMVGGRTNAPLLPCLGGGGLLDGQEILPLLLCQGNPERLTHPQASGGNHGEGGCIPRSGQSLQSSQQR